MTPDLAFNTSVSFETNTNWQNYSGETGVELPDLRRRSSRSATSRRPPTGLAVAIALFRGLTRRSTKTLGNYWVDLTRGVLYILLPLSIVGALVLVWQGVPQTWDPPTRSRRSRAPSRRSPSARSPRRSGSRSWATTAAASSTPTPPIRSRARTALTNWLEMFAILIAPFALTYTFGRYAGNQRQGWTIFGAMAAILLVGAVVAMNHEYVGNPLFPAGVDQAGIGNMEGKEDRFGAAVGGLFVRRHDRHQHGSHQRLARQLPADRRAGPAVQHGARRDHPRRHRRRHVRDARHRGDPRGVHRRADGRPDARVPRQEGRGVRDQDGDARRPRPRREHPRLHGPRQRRCRKDSPGPSIPGRTASARSCTRSRARRATTARPSPG